MSLPQVTIVGVLNKLETKHTPSGKEVTRFQVECSEKNAKGEWENLYIKGEVWENQSKFLNQYFKNGSVAVVTGKLVTNVYDKNDGSKAYEIKLLFPSVSFIPKEKQDNQSQSNQQPKQQNTYQAQNIDDINEDDIPDWF